MGPPIISNSGLYLTWHFSLFSSLYNRLKRSKSRTYNPEEASLFIIPYDLGLDGYMDKYTCKNRRSCTKGLVPKLESILRKSKYFNRYEGKDHVVLWSLGQYHPWPHNACDVFMRDTCGNCAFTCYWMDSTKGDSRFISVPFPSGYHWSESMVDIPWLANNQTRSIRNMTAVYLGSTQTLNPAHTKIRRAMTSQCTESKHCHWMQIGHSSIDNNLADFLTIYRRSIFCLCPPGDDPARKALFDIILSGCIPVIFEVATLYNQYPWHIGEETALDISVSIPGGQVRTGKIKFMDILLKISPEVIRKKQDAIARLAPRIQYSIPPLQYLSNISDATTWDPPFPDGVDMLVSGLFERSHRIINNQSGGVPPILLSGKEWGQNYDVVKIKIPDNYNSISDINYQNAFNSHSNVFDINSQEINKPGNASSLVMPTNILNIEELKKTGSAILATFSKADKNGNSGVRHYRRHHNASHHGRKRHHNQLVSANKPHTDTISQTSVSEPNTNVKDNTLTSATESTLLKPYIRPDTQVIEKPGVKISSPEAISLLSKLVIQSPLTEITTLSTVDAAAASLETNTTTFNATSSL